MTSFQSVDRTMVARMTFIQTRTLTGPIAHEEQTGICARLDMVGYYWMQDLHFEPTVAMSSTEANGDLMAGIKLYSSTIQLDQASRVA